MKPVVRWTIGNCSKNSICVLEESLKSFIKIYGHNFYYILTYNNIDEIGLKKIHALKFDKFINQHEIKNSSIEFPKKLGGPAWKFYPARTSLKTHEIMLDNDLVLYRRLDQIEKFIDSNSMFLITEASCRSYSLFEDLIPKNFNINSGFVALPPEYDYEKEVHMVIKNHVKDWNNHFDEQSVVAYILSSKNTEIIPINQISVSGLHNNYIEGTHGFHFVGLNNEWDHYWKKFKSKTLL